MRALYTVLIWLIVPLALLRLLWRGLQMRDYWFRWNERFGFVARPEAPVAVWVHAVSVGETLAALPLIRALVERHGRQRVLVTTTTPTGSQRVRDSLGDTVLHHYAPYDLPGAVHRVLERSRPQQVVIMETELWPNLFRAIAQRDIPLFIVNARLSANSLRGYSKVRGFAGQVLGQCTRILAQSEADAERFIILGAPTARVQAVGNIKFDQSVPDAQLDAGTHLRRQLGAGPVWAAVSTHEGEDELVLAAHHALRDAHPHARLILVPRHPQRFDAVARQVSTLGLSLDRRSTLQPDADAIPSSVLLGDSMGEMFMYLAAADLVLVGGSLVPVGGHNVLEPAALSKPVLHGPHMDNFTAARELLEAQGASLEVAADSRAIASALNQLISDPERCRRMGRAGAEAIAANRGTLTRILSILTPPPENEPA